MRLRHLFGVVIGTLSLLILWAGYEAMFPTGDEAGLVAIALFGVVVAAVCVGLPLGLLALTMLLPNRVRVRRSVFVIAALACALPGVLALPALGNVLTEMALKPQSTSGDLLAVGLMVFPFVVSTLLFRQAVKGVQPDPQGART